MIPPRRECGPALSPFADGERRRFALVALLFVLAQFGGLSHFAGVRHAVCEEHGRLEHGAAAAAPAADPEDPSPRVGAPHAESQDPHHDGCHLSFLTRAASFTKPAGVVSHCAAAAELRARHRFAPRAPASVPVIRLAPKHSPPASA